MINARQARLKFADPSYVQGMKDVTRAIINACPNSHRAVVNIPTGPSEQYLEQCSAAHVARALEENGFEVLGLFHDPENGSSELTVCWDRKIKNA